MRQRPVTPLATSSAYLTAIMFCEPAPRLAVFDQIASASRRRRQQLKQPAALTPHDVVARCLALVWGEARRVLRASSTSLRLGKSPATVASKYARTRRLRGAS